MNKLPGHFLIEDNDSFPAETDTNLLFLQKEMQEGNISIKLDSFEQIYDLCPPDTPFPLGLVSFSDDKNRFIIGWKRDFQETGIESVENYHLRLRFYPVEEYPVISLMTGISDGRINSDNGQELFLYGENSLGITFLSSRIKLFQLLQADEILFCLFDGSAENLMTYSFGVNKDEKRSFLREIEACYSSLSEYDLSLVVKQFAAGSKNVNSLFNVMGLPLKQEALPVYLKRKEYSPKPDGYNWKEYLSI